MSDLDITYNNEHNPQTKKFHRAIRNNEIEFIEKLFEYDFVQDINATDEVGFTALHIAVIENNLKVTEILIENGAELNVESSQCPVLPEIEILTYNDYRLEYYANLTPLHIAALMGSNAIVETLLKNGAKVNKANKLRARPLHCAIDSESAKTVKIILENGGKFGTGFFEHLFDEDMTDNERMFDYAATNGRLNVLKLLCKNSISIVKHSSTLVGAIQGGYEDVVRLLLQIGFNVHFHDPIRDEDRFAPIHVASEKGHIIILKMLIDHGANVNQFSKQYDVKTPLAIAAFFGNHEVANLLLQN